MLWLILSCEKEEIIPKKIVMPTKVSESKKLEKKLSKKRKNKLFKKKKCTIPKS